MLLKAMLAFRPSKTDLVFSIKTFLAAMLALYIAISLNLQNPMWAMGTVFIVANPLSGVLSSKAMYRLLGTLAGACLSLIALPPFINNPFPFSLLIAAWVSVCLYISLLDRTPRSYFFMLAGYTAALIGFSAVVDPTHLFDIALSRFEEITLGILCATIISRVFFPMSIGKILLGRIDHWFNDVEQSINHCLSGDRSAETTLKDAQRFASDSTEIYNLAVHLSYEKSALSGQTRSIQELQHQMILIAPALVTLSDRIYRLRQSSDQFDSLLSQVQQQTQQFMREAAPTQQVDLNTIPSAILHEFEQMLLLANVSQKLLVMNAREAFIFFLQHFLTLRLIWTYVREGKKLPAFINQKTVASQTLHRDHGVALRGGLSAFLALGIVCFLWHMSGWQYGFMAAQITAVAACILTFLDNPVPALASFRLASIYAALVVFIYQFAVFPLVHNFLELMLVLAPFFILFTSMLPNPALMGFVLPLLLNTAMGLNIRNLNEPIFGAYVDSSLAIIIGILIPSFTLALLRSATPEQSVQRLVRMQWRDVQQIIEKPVLHPWAFYMRRLLDRIGLMAPRVLRAPAVQHDISQAVSELAGATNIIRLKRVIDQLDAPLQQHIQQLLTNLWQWYEARLKQQKTTGQVGLDLSAQEIATQELSTQQPNISTPVEVLSENILQQIDQLLDEVLLQPSSMLRDQLLVAISGLRHTLFQHAPAYAVPLQPIATLGETYGWRA